jgi:hypothetical protein
MPQGRLGAGPEERSVPCAAKVESCWVSSVPLQAGHSACFEPMTMASNFFPQPLQMYSKIGIPKPPACAAAPDFPSPQNDSPKGSDGGKADRFIIRLRRSSE